MLKVSILGFIKSTSGVIAEFVTSFDPPAAASFDPAAPKKLNEPFGKRCSSPTTPFDVAYAPTPLLTNEDEGENITVASNAVCARTSFPIDPRPCSVAFLSHAAYCF